MEYQIDLKHTFVKWSSQTDQVSRWKLICCSITWRPWSICFSDCYVQFLPTITRCYPLYFFCFAYSILQRIFLTCTTLCPRINLLVAFVKYDLPSLNHDTWFFYGKSRHECCWRNPVMRIHQIVFSLRWSLLKWVYRRYYGCSFRILYCCSYMKNIIQLLVKKN